MKRYKSYFKENNKTNISIEDVKALSDDEKIMLLAQYPYSSMYEERKVFEWLQLWIAHNQGKRYSQTGNKKQSFNKRGIL